MNLQKKFIIINLALISLFLFISAISASSLIKKSVMDLEQDGINLNVWRAKSLLQKEATIIASITYDYSNWDDSYNFVKDNTTYYKESDETTLENYKIDQLVFFDLDMNILYKKSIDMNEYQEQELNDVYRNFSKKMEGTAGYLSLEGGIFVYAMAAVKDSEKILSPNGYLLFGKFIGEEDLKDLEEMMQLEVSLDSIEDNEVPRTGAPKTYFNDINSETYFSYPAIIGDSFFVKIIQERKIYEEATSTIHWIYFLIFIIGMFSFILVSLSNNILSNKITSPIKKLKETAIKISEGDLKKPSPIEADGELKELTDAIESMRVSLEKSRDELEKKVRVRTRELEYKNKEYEKTNKFLIGRELKMIELKKKLKKFEKGSKK